VARGSLANQRFEHRAKGMCHVDLFNIETVYAPCDAGCAVCVKDVRAD
jgi:hypothetical protein